MISGFNTDIESNGVVYHVQTEDKGLETPLILSLVYTGGEILAAKRSLYDDLIEKGFNENELTERLQRQHRLICAAIKQGRIEDLKRMSARESDLKSQPQTLVATNNSAPLPAEEIEAELFDPAYFSEVPLALMGTQNINTGLLPEPPIDLSEHSVRVLRAEDEEHVADFIRAESAPSDALNLTLLDEYQFRGGDRVVLRLYVTQGNGVYEKDVAGAEVLVKVLGASFRPIILSAKTIENGIASINLQLPYFKVGRAALLIRASYGGYEAELRRIVLQS